MVTKPGDVFGLVVISMSDAALHLQVVARLRYEELGKLGLGWEDYLELAGEQELETQYKAIRKDKPL